MFVFNEMRVKSILVAIGNANRLFKCASGHGICLINVMSTKLLERVKYVDS